MRGYLPVTVEEIAAFLDSQMMECGPLYAHNFVILKDLAKWENVQCAFLVSPDGEELTWFATQEIKPALSDWLQG